MFKLLIQKRYINKKGTGKVVGYYCVSSFGDLGGVPGARLP